MMMGGEAALSMCSHCGNPIENHVTYCYSCYDLRSESDFRNEQRWRNLESDLAVVEAKLQKEREGTKRLEETLLSFRHMLLQGVHADVTIETGEFDKTPAHRAVLVSVRWSACVFLSFSLLQPSKLGFQVPVTQNCVNCQAVIACTVYDEGAFHLL